MDTDRSDTEETWADRVYAEPASAHADAAELLADPESSPAQRAEALWTLGRAAYYSNRMSDAVVYLREALPIVDDPSRRVDLLLTLAPALSKEGKPEEGLALLDPRQPEFTDQQRGQLHNQRGIVLTELGRLPDAVADLEAARELLHTAGDDAAEARTLVNLGAAASMMGAQDEAERWYELAWDLTKVTGQGVVAAGIEGNLGYVASRRGDFATALGWYDRARQSFAGLGDVELLVAVLETDHASTLLDVGLDSDAVEAANYAVESSRSGNNRMLELQARLLLAEAQIRLDRYREAESNLRTARESAEDLSITPWAMRADYLLVRLLSLRDDDLEPGFATDVRLLAEGVLRAGWPREALRALIAGAQALLARADAATATELLDRALAIDALEHADAIDLEFARALRSHIAGEAATQTQATDAGLNEIHRQRTLLGSAELQVRIGHRAREFRNLAVATAITAGDAAAVLLASEASRAHLSRGSAAGSHETNVLLSELRDLRVGREEAQLAGASVGGHDDRIRSLEREILRSQRRDGGEREQGHDRDSLDADEVTSLVEEGSVLASYVLSEGTLWAVLATTDGARLVNLGPSEPVAATARRQRAALRRMATDASPSSGGPSARVDTANRELDRLLIEPLALSPNQSLTIVPARIVSGLAWSGLPSLLDVNLTVAPSLRMWADAPAQLVVRSAGLLGGAGLAHVDDELDAVSSHWGPQTRTVRRRSTVAEAAEVLASHELAHIAAHGTFRSDNPYFSSIEFLDGPLTLLDLEALPSVPHVVVIASCDAAATAGGTGTEVVGTTSTMLGLGVSAVIAPNVAVGDLAARHFSTDLHRLLVAGESIDAAAREARQLARGRATPADWSAAQSFQVHGNSAASQALRVARS